MLTQDSSKTESGTAPIVALQFFCRSTGISPITAWRFRKRGWIETVNIAGRQYLTAEAIANFTRRATAGEFAQKHTIPARAVATQLN